MPDIYMCAFTALFCVLNLAKSDTPPRVADIFQLWLPPSSTLCSMADSNLLLLFVLSTSLVDVGFCHLLPLSQPTYVSACIVVHIPKEAICVKPHQASRFLFSALISLCRHASLQ